MSTPDESQSSDQPRLSRRDLLKGLAAFGAGAALSGCATNKRSKKTGNLIRKENEREGTRSWLLEKTRVDPATKYRCPWIEGYCSRTSVRPGESVSFHVSTNPASPFTLDL